MDRKGIRPNTLQENGEVVAYSATRTASSTLLDFRLPYPAGKKRAIKGISQNRVILHVKVF